MKKILITACLIACWILPAMADDVKTVENLLKEKTDQVLATLRQPDMADTVKKNRIMEIINPIIDFELMAKLTLGRTNWGKLDKAQQAEFVSLFVERLKRSYLDKSTLYGKDEKIVYRSGSARGNKVHVPVEIVTSEKPIELLYKFYLSGDGWKAYDVEINGVSLIKSYQAQFSEVLRNGTAEDLLKELKKTETQ